MNLNIDTESSPSSRAPRLASARSSQLAERGLDVVRVDPRIIRTNQLIFGATRELLAEEAFESITMRDIAKRSTVNRATIYTYFKDKRHVVESLTTNDFSEFLDQRMQKAPAIGNGGAKELILSICDFVTTRVPLSDREHFSYEAILECNMRIIVRDFLISGISRKDKSPIWLKDLDLNATAASWAICGVILLWNRKRTKRPDRVVASLLPIVAAALKAAIN